MLGAVFIAVFVCPDNGCAVSYSHKWANTSTDAHSYWSTDAASYRRAIGSTIFSSITLSVRDTVWNSDTVTFCDTYRCPNRCSEWCTDCLADRSAIGLTIGDSYGGAYSLPYFTAYCGTERRSKRNPECYTKYYSNCSSDRTANCSTNSGAQRCAHC